jgi:hypothetical protein
MLAVGSRLLDLDGLERFQFERRLEKAETEVIDALAEGAEEVEQSA